MGATGLVGAPDTRRLLRVRGIGRREKDATPRAVSEERRRPHTAELITGLYGYRIPFAFAVTGAAAGVDIRLGTWSAKDAPSEGQDRRLGVVESVLRGLYPVVETEPVPDVPAVWPLAGLALGIPAPAGIDEADGAAPIDRIIRSLPGSDWAALVLAYPVAESAVSAARSGALNEVRMAESGAESEGAPSPLAKQYVELLETQLDHLAEGLATGAWRTAVYLLGDGDSYPRLATAWRSVFSGEKSVPEPVRVYDRIESADLARSWALPDEPGAPGPGSYQRPFEFQTLLTTAQLAAYAHLPELETPGFQVDLVPRFDAIPAARQEEPDLAVGRIVHQRRDTGSDYSVSLRSLTRHAFVAGLTGSGKTNTIFSLLDEADAAGVPFLVVEPAKTEYRALLEHPRIGPRLRVFTAGKATVAPFLLNPFEVPEGIGVSEHIDLVRTAFAAAFGMWTPLPQLLERCMHAVYADRGWDLRTNENARLGADGNRADAFPTLADLVAKVAEVIPTLGYEDRVTADLQASLTTRLEALRMGGKGTMLDVARSLPIGELLNQPAVLELEAMGDEGDKAFLMGMILIRLAEHRRAAGQRPDLIHLLVVEEAHRLLANVTGPTSEESANPRGQAVESFTNLLSEIRAYGQGVVIADQVPVRLAPDVIKNTNLKIAHRTVSADDRAALGGAMAMDDAQARALTTLSVGEAAVFSSGDDEPLLIRVPLAKDRLSSTPPGDARVTEHMAAWRTAVGVDELFLPRPFCAATCAGAYLACEAARRVMADGYVQQTLARTVLSTIEDAGALDRMWDDLVSTLRARQPPRVAEDQLLRAFAGHGADWFASRRGSQHAWSYASTAQLADRLRAVLLEKVGAPDADGSVSTVRSDFQALARELHRRTYHPYPACDAVCTQEPPQCLYRYAAADLVASGRYQPKWREADAADAAGPDDRRHETWEVCQDAGYELIEFPEPDDPSELRDRVAAAARRTCLCFEQQMLADDERKVPRTSRNIMARVMREAAGG